MKKPARPARWAAHTGLVGVVSAAAIVVVQGLDERWTQWIGRARPYEVLYGEDPFTAWYEFGPHFVSEGVYHGSFPSGHTAQAALLLTLAYLLAGAFGDRPWGRSAAWGWGVLSLCLAAAMGMARVMSLSHWLTDVIAGLFLTWIGIHLTYHLVLRVPDQTAFFRRAGTWPQAPEGWELRLSAWLLAVLAGAAAAVLGIRALFRPQEPVFVPLLPLGAAVFFVSLYMARGARRRALQELDGPGE